MSENLDFVLRVTNKSYIDNFDDIGMIMEHVLKTTVDEFNRVIGFDMKKIMQYIREDVIKCCGKFGTECEMNDPIGNATLLDMFGGLSFLRRCGGWNEDTLGHAQYITKMLTEAGEKLTWHKLFMGISVESLIGFLESESDSTFDYARSYEAFCEAANEYASLVITESTTLDEVFKKLNFEIFKPWYVYSSIENYSKKVLCCCETVIKLTDIINAAYSNTDYLEAAEAENGFDDIDFEDFPFDDPYFSKQND